MPMYRVTFRGGGPRLESNVSTEQVITASSPHVAVSRVMARLEDPRATERPLRLRRGAWVHLTVTRIS